VNNPGLPPIDNPQLELEALTHSSYSNEYPGEPCYERLEFLGDAVLGFVVGKILYDRYPHFTEAELTRLRAQLVNRTQLAYLARFLQIGPEIRLGKSLEKAGGRENASILSDVFESLMGACLLDQGLETLRAFLEELFLPILQEWEKNQASLHRSPQPMPTLDVKNILQQWALANVKQLPEYKQIEVTGPDHARQFTFTVSVAGEIYGQGSGPSKQVATKQAAIAALEKLGLIDQRFS
jgi:ribonuclease-3